MVPANLSLTTFENQQAQLCFQSWVSDINLSESGELPELRLNSLQPQIASNQFFNVCVVIKPEPVLVLLVRLSCLRWRTLIVHSLLE